MKNKSNTQCCAHSAYTFIESHNENRTKIKNEIDFELLLLISEEPFPQQRDDINAELSNSSESIFLRKFDRFQLHQPYPVMMQRDHHRLPLSRNVRMSTHENSHLVKSQSLSPLESMPNAQQMPKANYTVNDAMYLARSRSTSLTLKPNTTIVQHITKTGEDSSQSSLNLSASSGYLSGSSSANSSNLNLSGRSSSSSTYVFNKKKNKKQN